MVRAEIYAEGGGPPGRATNIRCREGFTKLLENCGLDSRKFNVIACGGGGDAWNDFQDAHADASGEYYVGLLIDSEDAVADIDAPWKHLGDCHNWVKPTDAQDDQVLLMTRCMEAWIAADRTALSNHFGQSLRISELPDPDSLEELSPGSLNDVLESATRCCEEPFRKGRSSFTVLGRLNPNILEEHLPSFQRARRILKEKLG